MKFITRIILFSLIAVLCACNKKAPKPSVIDENRIIEVEVECRTFDGSTKIIQLKVLDVTANSIKKAFAELLKNNFPIYGTMCYENRNIVYGSKVSLHAYGAAIDINEHLNPYYNVLKGTSSITPKRFVDRTEDEKELRTYLKTANMIVKETELDATISAILQTLDSDDWFINREIFRKGMITLKEAEIFAKNGFTVWGGMWKQPMDFMHMQIPRKLAERLASISKEEGDIIWANHLLITKWHLILKKKLEKIPKEKEETILADHLKNCQQDDDYLAAADKKETTAICVSDCKRKISGH